MDNFTLDKAMSEATAQTKDATMRNMQEIFVLLNHLERLAVTEMNQISFEYPVRMIDNRCQVLLRTLNFNPAALPHIVLFEKQEDERLQDIQETAELSKKNPEAAIPYIITAYCKSISRRADEDLLAFATDFKAARNLQFRISFSSFAVSFSSIERDSELKRISRRLWKMGEEGFVMKSSWQKDRVLADCDKNRQLLRNYCEGRLVRSHSKSARTKTLFKNCGYPSNTTSISLS